MANFRSQDVRARWLKTAVCPSCNESNRATATNLIEVNELAQAQCNACGHEWKADT